MATNQEDIDVLETIAYGTTLTGLLKNTPAVAKIDAAPLLIRHHRRLTGTEIKEEEPSSAITEKKKTKNIKRRSKHLPENIEQKSGLLNKTTECLPNVVDVFEAPVNIRHHERLGGTEIEEGRPSSTTTRKPPRLSSGTDFEDARGHENAEIKKKKKTKAIKRKLIQVKEALLKTLNDAQQEQLILLGEKKIGDKGYVSSEIMQVPQDFSDDPFTINLYKKALQEGMELDHSLRVNVVGNFCQGKTSLVRRLVGESIDNVEMTNGIDISQYHLKHSVDGSIIYEKGSFFKDDRDFLSRIISIAKSIEAKERKSVSDDKHFENIDEESNEELTSFLQEIKSGKLSLRSDFTEELSLWDFGGQYIFYATHTLFHSARAIYLLVFDLSCGLDDIVKDEKFPSETGDKTMEYFLKFWLNSIHSFVGSKDASHPPVILVGTHKDQLRGTDEEKQEAANVQFGKVRALFDGTDVLNHIQFEDFAIDNTNEDDKGIKDLKKELLKIARRDEFKSPIPAKWIHLEKSLYKLQKQKIITFEEVMKEDAKNEFPVGNKEGVTLFLQYHHARGTLVFFNEGSISNYVVLDPQYLVDAFKCIITSQNFCIKDPVYRPLWNNLTSKGILESKLIDKQWEQEGKVDFLNWRNVLLEILKKHCVIAEALKYDEKYCTSTELGWYIVPSLLKDHSPQKVIDDFLNGKRRTLVRLVYKFQDSSVTKAEYDRLIATSLGMWAVVIFREKHLLFKNLGVFRIGSNQVGIIEEVLSEQTIELIFVARSGEITEGQGDELRRLAESVFNQSQRRRGIDNVSKTFTVMCRCNHASHGQGKSKLMNMSDLKTRSEVPCEDYENHTFKVQEAVSEWFLPKRIESYDIPVIELSEKVLSRLSQLAFSDNWELLGVELGVEATKIDHLKEDYRTTPMKIFEMFRIWSRKSGDQATFQTLLKACKQVPSLKVNWDEIRNIVDDINKVQITHF